MTFVEALNDEACSAGLEDGQTWFLDSNGDEPETVGEFRLLRNNSGVSVERGSDGWDVSAVDPDGKTHWASFTSDCSWE